MYSLTYDKTIGFAQLLYNVGVDKSASSFPVTLKLSSFSIAKFSSPKELLAKLLIFL